MFFKLLEANIAKLAPRPLVVFFFFSQLWSASQEFGALSPLQIFFAIYRFRKTLCRSRSLAPLNRDQSILRVVPAVVPATKPGRLRPDFRRTTLRPSSFHASVTLFFSACGGGPVNVRVRELACPRRPTVRFGRRVLPRCPWCTGLEAPASAASVLLDGNAAGRTLRSTNRCL